MTQATAPQTMWVVFKETYCGPEGVFSKGDRKELTVKKLRRIKKKFWQESNPPWEDHLDKAAVDQAAAQSALQKATHHLTLIEGRLNKALENRKRLVAAHGNLLERSEKIEGLVEKAQKTADARSAKLAKAKTPKSKKEKQKYETLQAQAEDSRLELDALQGEARRLPALALKAEGQVMIADADMTLIDCELTDAHAVVAELKETLGIEDDKDDKKDTDQQAAQTEGDQSDNDNTGQQTDDAETQTD